MWNNISANWDPQITRSVGEGPRSVFIGDTNNDGYNDICTANINDNTISILLWNNTIGDWNPQIIKSGIINLHNLCIGDADNDGDNDIVTASSATNNILIFLWNNTISDWDPEITKSVGNGPDMVYIGDANNDGYNDIITANRLGNTVSILLWVPHYVNISTPENSIYNKPMSGYYLCSNGFENDEIGSEPEWFEQIGTNGGTVQVIGTLDGHEYVLDIYDSSTGILNAHVRKLLPSMPSSGTVEYWMRVDDSTKVCGFRIDQGAIPNEMVTMRTFFNFLQYNNGTDWNTIRFISNNTWYHIRVDFECTTGNYQGLSQYSWRLYVNDTQYGDYPFANNQSYAYRTTWYNDYLHAMSDYHYYLDAIGFSWDSKYHIGDNLNEGMLLSIEENFDHEWICYSIDGSTNVTILGNIPFAFPSDGQHSIQVFAQDSAGDIITSDLRYFFIDTTSPEIIINSPAQNYYFGMNAPTFDISIIEPNLNSTWYTLDSGTTNITFSGLTGTINQTEWEGFGPGPVTIEFYANDTFGLEDYNEVTVIKELNAPSSSISFIPHSGVNIVNKSTLFSLSADDSMESGVAVIRYKVNNSNWVDYINSFSLSAYPAGDYLITYYAIDVAGNTEMEHSILVTLVDIPSKSSSTIPGYNMFLTIGIICTLLFIFFRRKYKIK